MIIRDKMLGPLGNIDEALLSAFFFYGALLGLKVFLVVIGIILTRLNKYAFSNPEDAVMSPKARVTYNDVDVERVRRAHQNDLENILPFFFIGFAYLTISPPVSQALWLFRAFAWGRIIHTVVYLAKIPQPARFFAFAVPFGINCYMAIQVVTHYWN